MYILCAANFQSSIFNFPTFSFSNFQISLQIFIFQRFFPLNFQFSIFNFQFPTKNPTFAPNLRRNPSQARVKVWV